MKPRYDFREQDIKEGCVGGTCQGICRELHLANCPCHYRYVIVHVRIRRKLKRYKLYLDENNKVKET